MSDFLGIFDIGLVVSTIRLTSPILLSALGGMFNERAGIFNIGLEGQMLVGAFLGVAGANWAGSWVAGVALAVAGTAAMSLAFGLWVIELGANDIVVGLAINLLAAGLTAYLSPVIFGVQGSFDPPGLSGLPVLHIPLVDGIPVLGDAVSGYSPLVYLCVLLVPGAYWLLFRHPVGVRLRAVGEDREAAGSVGIGARRMQYLSCLLCGVLCGLAGAQLSLGLVTQWVDGMTAGRGYIALVAIMLARAHPLAVGASSLLFGLSYALAVRLQGIGIAPQFVSMLPYALTIGALVVMHRRGALWRTRSARRRERAATQSMA